MRLHRLGVVSVSLRDPIYHCVQRVIWEQMLSIWSNVTADDLEMGRSREQLTRFLLCSREAERRRHRIISATYCVSNIKKFNKKEIARA